MKNKKLFAILTLVCFMFTLMPVAAFAATETTITGPAYANIATGYTTVEKDEEVKINVTYAGSYYVYATNAAGKLATVAPFEGSGDQVGKTVLADVEANGTISVAFAKPGTYTIALAPYVNDTQAGIIENADWAKTDAQVLTFLEGFTGVAMYNNVVKVGDVEDSYNVVLTLSGSSVSADAGFTNLTGTVQVTNNGYGVPNADVDLYTDSYGLQVTKIDAKTNAAGIARFQVSGTIASGVAGFNVYASYEGETDSANVQVITLGAASVETVAEPKAPVDKGTVTTKSGIEFKFFDANGATAAPGARGTGYKVTVVAAPADYTRDTTQFTVTTNANGNYVIEGPALKYEGDYTFQVSLKNGAYATGSVTVKKFDTPVAIQFVKAPTTVALGAADFDVAPYGIVAVDANGVTKTVAANSYSVNGKAVLNYDVDGLDVKGDKDDYIGTKISVLAVYKYNNKTFTAVNEITVVDSAATVVYNATTAEVGINNTLTASIVDANGKKVELDGATVEVIVLEKPENAVVTANALYNNDKDLVYVTFLASVAGEYKVQTIATVAGKYVSGIETITVGGGEGTFKDVVVMSIGAAKVVVNSDVKDIAAAPIIKDGRTFVPFRALAEAFGANVEWVEASQSVVAELNGVKVVMVIGANEYTVNGVAKTADVAPFINGASTMVPVRFVAEAFGINVTPIYAENGAVADVLFAK